MRIQSISNAKRCFSIASKELIHKSITPTFHFQNSLLRLPIPKLEDTLSRYLSAVQPVVSEKDFQITRRAAEEFQLGIGQELHNTLLAQDAANPHTSYINQIWLDIYLGDKRPLSINYNPQMTLRDDPEPRKNQWTQRATSLIASSVRFYRTLQAELLKPDVFHTKPSLTKSNFFDYYCKMLPNKYAMYGAAAFGAYPLDMSQYSHLFSSVRIPKKGEKDTLVAHKDSEHVVVQRGARFYKVSVLDPNMQRISEERILSQLNQIVAEPLRESDKNGIGAFTSMNRDRWADARHEFSQLSNENKALLQSIDTALFMVTLEDHAPVSDSDSMRTFLVGNGSNHWFDKSFQLIVASNGKAAVNFEHSWGDGISVLRYATEIYEDSIQSPLVSEPKAITQPQFLEHSLNPSLQKTLQAAHAEFQRQKDRLVIECAKSLVTRSQIARFGISADGIMQMTIQLAYFKLYQRFVSTYESASTAAFKHGRTETIRSCTNEAVAFVKNMTNGNASLQDKHQALIKAVTRHAELAKAAVTGQGHDRHMLALETLAKGKSVELFNLSSAQIMKEIILSTSTLSSTCLEGGGFGPVHEKGFGIGYGIENDGASFQMTSYSPDLSEFSRALMESLSDIEQVLHAADQL